MFLLAGYLKRYMCTDTHDVSPIILAKCLANLRLLVFTVKKLWLITRIDPIRALYGH